MNIAFTTDSNYIVPTFVAVFSLLTNYKGLSKIDIYIIVDSEKSTIKLTEMFDSLIGIFHNFDIHYININSCCENNNILTNIKSQATMYRLFIPHIIQIDRLLYIDSDVIIEGDISEIFNWNRDNMCLSGVKDLSITTRVDRDHSMQLEIPNTSQYINAGVILMNLNKIREIGLHDKCLDLAQKKSFKFKDQDIINSVFYGKIGFLPFQANVMCAYITRNDWILYHVYGKDNINKARKEPIIIHYSGFRKPWKYRHMYGAYKWWKYINMLDEKTMQEYIMPFLEKQKASIVDQARERVETMIKYVGFFPVVKRIEKKLSTFSR